VLPDVTRRATNIFISPKVTLIVALKMPIQSKPREHTMPNNNEEVQKEVEERTGTRPCIWQIEVVRMVLDGKDVITIAVTGSGKSFPYWMPLLYIKYGIVILVTPLKLLGKQFVDILEKNQLRAVSMIAANATNKLIVVVVVFWTFVTYIASYIPFYNSVQSQGHDSNRVQQFYDVHFILHRIT